MNSRRRGVEMEEGLGQDLVKKQKQKTKQPKELPTTGTLYYVYAAY